ncbi:hypothetical protein CspHIS471_0602460 [Cutaneotrichosporon sp. HIS471]|nr:hypothetical protein CspHIS471_0602460 [Cutaneotrichosporon sp. HIS471]
MSGKRSTVYVAGLPAAVNEDQLLATFVTFGDILEISLPHEHDSSKHRGYAFITFAEAADAQDAIDNYDLNELPGYAGQGKFLKCSIANPNKYGADGSGKHDRALWESEEWLRENAGTGPDLAAEAAADAQNGV